jgi:hypothetical protein
MAISFSDGAAVRLEVFPDDNGGVEGVALVLHGYSIVESENGELVGGCKLTHEQARSLAGTLMSYVE